MIHWGNMQISDLERKEDSCLVSVSREIIQGRENVIDEFMS